MSAAVNHSTRSRIAPISLGAGLLLLAAVWLPATLGLRTPLANWPFSEHMIRHMVLVAIAAPLLVFGLPDRFRALGVSPLAAAAVEFFVVWGWHAGALHEAAAVSALWFVAEQASFLVAGLAVWASALTAPSALAGAGGLLLTTMHMTLLGALLTLAPRTLYDAICFGGQPLADQQIGGMLMLAIGTPVYLAGGVFLVHRALFAHDEPVEVTA